MKRHLILLFMILPGCFSIPGICAEALPKILEGVTISEHLGNTLNLELSFTNQDGKKIQLKDFFTDHIPVLLTLNYYRCPSLCSLELNALTEGLRNLGWIPGEKFRVVTLSIDHRETYDLAAQKRSTYLKLLDKGDDIDWSFLVGSKENIAAVASTVGFEFKYDPEQDQYAHPAAIFFLSPEGKVARYLYGISFPSQSIKFALMEASAGRLGSPADKLILSCFHYDASAGRYGPFALGMMRLGGMVTIMMLSIWLVALWRRDPDRKQNQRGLS